MAALALRVLILDSNSDAADALASGLHACGHETVAICPGEASVRLADHFGPDIVLCAYHPCDIEVQQTLRAMRWLPGFEEVLVLMLADPIHAEEASCLGHAVACQPVGPATVMQAITGAILAHSGPMAEVIPLHGERILCH
ncbi:hypothetical protein [Pseudoduganella sp. RAF53_2]|jgi:CheY-like chemotaxis protein|uniref:hypothetical protein n=1 Tax=unclassified Pseudoduganella TaxID=2637179 RepID=UPI003F94EA86